MERKLNNHIICSHASARVIYNVIDLARARKRAFYSVCCDRVAEKGTCIFARNSLGYDVVVHTHTHANSTCVRVQPICVARLCLSCGMRTFDGGRFVCAAD